MFVMCPGCCLSFACAVLDVRLMLVCTLVLCFDFGVRSVVLPVGEIIVLAFKLFAVGSDCWLLRFGGGSAIDLIACCGG